ADLLEPAIRYAAGGYPCTESQTAWTAVNLDPADTERKALGRFEGFRRTFLTPSGEAPAAGRVVANRDLARTLEAIAAGGRDAFYRGELAERIARGLAEAGSPLTAEDMA